MTIGVQTPTNNMSRSKKGEFGKSFSPGKWEKFGIQNFAKFANLTA